MIRGFTMVVLLFLGVLFVAAVFLSGSLGNGSGMMGTSLVVNEGRNSTFSSQHRKLLLLHETPTKQPDRISESCTKSDILINQGATDPLPNGIPTYTVEIMNACVTGCDISRIHLKCGWFSSDSVINPKIFKRVRYNDCLVNNGKPLRNGGSLSFKYANTYRYPLSISSVVCT